MDLKEIVAISGMSGLFKVVVRRADGLIVQSFDEDHAKFVSNRVHIFTPLDGITMYTHTDNIELAKVLLAMKKEGENTPPIDPKENTEAHKKYFKVIVPDFDENRVYVSDIKKVIKWYHLLNEKGLITEEAAEEPNENVEQLEEGKKAKSAKKEPKAIKTAAPAVESTEMTVKVKKPAKAKK